MSVKYPSSHLGFPQVQRIFNTHLEPANATQNTHDFRPQTRPIHTLNRQWLSPLNGAHPKRAHQPIFSCVNNPTFLSQVLLRQSHLSAPTLCDPTPFASEKNIFLHTQCGLPPFSTLKGSDLAAGITKAIKDHKSMVDNIFHDKQSPSWAHVCAPLENAQEKIDYLEGLLYLLNSLTNQRSFKLADEICSSAFSDHASWCVQNKKLYYLYKAVEQSPTFTTLSKAKQEAVKNRLSTLKSENDHLTTQQKRRLNQISNQIDTLSQQFSANLMAATNGWSQHILNEDDLLGMPCAFKAIAKEKAEKKGLEGYLLTLDDPCVHTVLRTCEDAEIRKNIFVAYTTRASEMGPNAKKWDNGPVIAEILTLRQEMATLQGFNNYSDFEMTKRMAPSSEAVFKFLQELANNLHDTAEKENAELWQYTFEKYGVKNLNPWDLHFFSSKLKEDKFQICAQSVRAYFPTQKVLEGLFSISKHLYGVTITQDKNASTWHPDVHLYEVREENGVLCGRFYLDPYSREGKRGGAWVMGAQPRHVCPSGVVQHPEAYVICNFSKPAQGYPSTLTHDDVTTLFHEMGHCFHHMLTSVDASAVSGTRNVPRDGVELPSQLMENWCWNKEGLKLISSHQETGLPLPDEMIDNLIAAKNFQGAKALLNQIKLALMDMVFHSGFDLNEITVNDMTTAVKEYIAINPSPDFARPGSGFMHIFSGSYASGYYGYLWSEVMSAAAFERFEKEGILSREKGEDFRKHILSKGGSEDMMKLLVGFLGEEPSIQAFLRQHGLKK